MPLSHFQPERYAEQLDCKCDRLAQALQPAGITEFEVHASAPLHYRMRAEFRIWHEGDHCEYVMFRPEDPRTPVPVTHFPVACETISRLMPRLLDTIQADARLRQRLYQAEFLATTTGECLVTLVYHKRLDEHWVATATAMAHTLGISLVGRSRGRKTVIGQDWITERLQVDGREWTWRQPEGAFTQPNAGVNRAMLDWACRQAPGAGDLLELYCGIGNFTLPLSRRFRKVLATEVNKTACRTAEYNMQQNGVTHTVLARLSSDEAASALRGDRPFRRLAGIDLASYDFRCLFVDPPRAGLDEATRQLASRFDHLLYVSCNPDTLFRDVTALAGSHRIRRAALFDQFPYTEHMECGLLLERC